MTKKHFEAIAADIRIALNEADGDAERYGVRMVANRLVTTFIGMNPLFDKKKFLTACGL